MGDKQPVSVLVVVHTSDLHVLLLERADFPDHWQSVTGSRDEDERFADTARRELLEETGIDADVFGGPVDWKQANRYEIFPQWRHRYPPGTRTTRSMCSRSTSARRFPWSCRRASTCAMRGCPGRRPPHAVLVVEPRRDPGAAGARRQDEKRA